MTDPSRGSVKLSSPHTVKNSTTVKTSAIKITTGHIANGTKASVITHVATKNAKEPR